MVTFGEGEAKKTITVPFLVIDCPSLYNCIIGRTRLAQLGAAKRWFIQANKSQSSVSQPSKLAEDKGKAAASVLDTNLVELDPRFTKEDLKEQNREHKDPLNSKLLRPIPDGEFDLVPFRDDPSKNFKIDKDLQNLSKLS